MWLQNFHCGFPEAIAQVDRGLSRKARSPRKTGASQEKGFERSEVKTTSSARHEIRLNTRS